MLKVSVIVYLFCIHPICCYNTSTIEIYINISLYVYTQHQNVMSGMLLDIEAQTDFHSTFSLNVLHKMLLPSHKIYAHEVE